MSNTLSGIKLELEKKFKNRPKIIKDGRHTYQVQFHWSKRGFPEDINYTMSYHHSMTYQSWSISAFNAGKDRDELGNRTNIIECWEVANYDEDVSLLDMFSDPDSYVTIEDCGNGMSKEILPIFSD